MRVLVVEDESYLAGAIRDGLRLEAIAADIAGDGDTALELLSVNAYDIAVLDRDIPGPSGDEIAESIVASGSGTPILMLTAADRLDDKASGFGLGADDYLTKPFALEELLARVRALLRRAVPGAEDTEERLAFADLTMDLASREVYRGSRLIDLTRTEFSLLELFLRRPRRVLERSFILEEVWGFDFPTTANSLEVYVGYVRRKLEAEGEPRLLHTVRGVGYVLRDQPG